MMWIAYALAWISTATAVSVGIYYTDNPKCLLALFIPALIRVSTRDDKKEKSHGETET